MAQYKSWPQAERIRDNLFKNITQNVTKCILASDCGRGGIKVAYKQTNKNTKTSWCEYLYKEIILQYYFEEIKLIHYSRLPGFSSGILSLIKRQASYTMVDGSNCIVLTAFKSTALIFNERAMVAVTPPLGSAGWTTKFCCCLTPRLLTMEPFQSKMQECSTPTSFKWLEILSNCC